MESSQCPASCSPLQYTDTLCIYAITKMTRCLQRAKSSNNPERSAVPLAGVTNPCTYSSNPPSSPKQDKLCDLNFTGDWLERDGAGWHCSAHTHQSTPSPHFISTERDNIQPSEQSWEKTTWASPLSARKTTPVKGMRSPHTLKGNGKGRKN